MSTRQVLIHTVTVLFCLSACGGDLQDEFQLPPHEWQLHNALERTRSPDPAVRAGAVEQIGFMRLFSTEEMVRKMVADSDAAVRREAAMALGWLGNRDSLKPLVDALGDSDWTVRQSAAVSLGNLTAKKLPFNALASEAVQKKQQKAWVDFLVGFDGSNLLDWYISQDAPMESKKVYEAEAAKLKGGINLVFGRNSSGNKFADYTAKRGATIAWTVSAPTAGSQKVAFRYSLGTGQKRPLKLSVNGMVVEESLDFPRTKNFDEWTWLSIPVELKKGKNMIELTAIGQSGGNYDCLIVFEGEQNPEILLGASQKLAKEKKAEGELGFFAKADCLRAAGVMDLQSATPTIIEALRPYLTKNYPYNNHNYLYTPKSPAVDARPERAFVQAGLRTLGRLGGAEAESFLIEMLDVPNWACYAAEALGDCGGPKAVDALITAFPDYAVLENHPQTFNSYDKAVKRFPKHDAPHLSAVDRVPRTAYEIASALCRLDVSKHRKQLVAISPSILATVPNMWDATVVYNEEPWSMIFGYLLEKGGVREAAADAAFTALGVAGRELPDSFELKEAFMKQASKNLDQSLSRHAPYAGEMLIAVAQPTDVEDLISLLNHTNGWIKIETAKALALLNAQEAVVPLITLLEKAKDDADYGYGMDFRRFNQTYVKVRKWLPGHGYDELNDPSPRFKEGYIRALGILKAAEAVPLLTDHLNNDRNALEIQYAAALALSDIATPAALGALKTAEANHPVAVVKVAAREALWRNSVQQEFVPPQEKTRFIRQQKVPDGLPQQLVFIKGDREPGNNEQFSKDMTAYSTTDGGPTYRLGRNLFTVETNDPTNSLRQLTHFESGYVADLEVSYDGQKLLFTHCTMDPEPWFHIYEMNVDPSTELGADGSRLKQLTFGPYHDVHPNFMPDGRIVFTSSRSGIRDEYHGYPANGLTVMNADGSDIHMVGFNIGRDAEPVIGDDGKILFTRLELFYSRMKTEWNLLSVFPDGKNPVTHYGPERRDLHRKIDGADAVAPPRHRALRLTQPQSWNGAEYLLNTFKGPMIAGPGRNQETFLNPSNTWAVTTPYKISADTLLVSAGKRPIVSNLSQLTKKQKRDGVKIGDTDYWESVDHGLYWMDVKTGKKSLIYNDPETADFEARPLQARKVPPILPGSPLTRSRAFSGTVYCSSAFITQDPHVKERGKYIRVVEGIPTITRHQTHADGGIAWRNHGGAVGRVFGTVPLAADGSFSLELPSDRLFHLQVLDSDRRVMGNELIWQYVRPKEIKGCVGCHENPDDAPSMPSAFPLAQRQTPIQCFPHGDEMQYRAKMWSKGWAPDEREERMRTVNSINIMGRN